MATQSDLRILGPAVQPDSISVGLTWQPDPTPF